VILPDITVLVYAYRREAPDHERYATWLAGLVGGADDLALTDVVLTGVVRIVTHPRIVADPAPMTEALPSSARCAGRGGPAARPDHLSRGRRRQPPQL
jgi:predicted nucleic acid-binding protein